MKSLSPCRLGPLSLSLSVLRRSGEGGHRRALLVLDACVETANSSASIEGLVVEYGDVLNFLRSMQAFQAQQESQVALRVALPHFDLLCTGSNPIATEVRLSPDFREEWHVYRFSPSRADVRTFINTLEVSLVSAPLPT